MTGGTPSRPELGDLTLDLARNLLLRGSEDVSLRRKSFDLLAYLARNAGRVVSKDELLAAIWPDVILTEDSLKRCVLEVRRALGPEGRALLRTFPRRGYLRVAEGDPAPAASRGPGFDAAAGSADGAGPHLRRDGVAVLPFAPVASDDPADAIRLDGLAHDVIGRLARLPCHRRPPARRCSSRPVPRRCWRRRR